MSTDEVRLYARKRHEASMHEAGHAIMWRVFGFTTEAHIWPETDGWAGRVHPPGRHAPDYLGPVQARMIGVAGAIAEAIFIWRVSGYDDDWTWLMSDMDWSPVYRCGRIPPPIRAGQIPPPSDHLDTLWKRAATLVEKRFDPDMGGDLWSDVCKTARQIRKQALTEEPLDMVVYRLERLLSSFKDAHGRHAESTEELEAWMTSACPGEAVNLRRLTSP